MTNNQYFIDKSIAMLQEMNEEDCAVAIDELRNELERVKGIARDRLATIAALRSEVDTAIGIIDGELVEVDELSCQGMLDALESALSPAGNDGLYGAYLRGELDQ
tara:strand:+ start:222 stop:536 length:315 start_codon:yes stop_codon:yes gene_type:complete